MHKIRNLLIVLAVMLQCGTLGAICFQREMVLRTGTPVFLRTVPIDPRDLFRGDYVRLSYDVSIVPTELIPKEELESMRKPGKRVYLRYRTDARNVMIPEKLSLKEPGEGRFIRGYTAINPQDSNSIQVSYSVEKYFMQQGKGLILQEGESLEGVAIPLEMEAAIGNQNGIAVLKGYRYAEMGMGVQTPRANDRTEKLPLKVQVKLVNASEKPLAIIDPENHSTFKIKITNSLDANDEEIIRLKNPPGEMTNYQEADIKIIPSKSLYAFDIDLTEPRYQLVRGKSDISWDQLRWDENALIEYKTPSPDIVAHLENSSTLWQGRLYSPPFRPSDFRD